MVGAFRTYKSFQHNTLHPNWPKHGIIFCGHNPIHHALYKAVESTALNS